MNRTLLVFCILALAAPAHADSLKLTVGHMCCGGCRAAATAGVKTVAWADNVAIDGDAITVTAKAGQKIELVSLMDALNKAGFPAMEIQASGPVTLTMGHLCCGSCAADLKTKLGAVRSQVLDRDNVKIDVAAKTLTIQPMSGQTMNLVPILQQLQRDGFSASSCSLIGPAATAAK